MKTETIADILQGKDINSEDAIVTLSDRIWEIGSLAEIKFIFSEDLKLPITLSKGIALNGESLKIAYPEK